MIDNRVIEDQTSKRVRNLTTHYLTKIVTDERGWDTLYQDPIDKRYWEKVYLQSELHGGGPPSLLNINEEKARKKYEF